MNNQGRNSLPTSLAGNSSTTPQQAHSHTQIPDAVALLLAQQAQLVQANHGQVQSRSLAQLIQAHLQSQAHSIAQLHNANAIASAIAANVNSNNANANALAIANAHANAIAIANANAIARTNAIVNASANVFASASASANPNPNPNPNANANASASASVVPSSSTAKKSKKKAAKKSTSRKKNDSSLPETEKQQVQEKLVERLPDSVFYTKLLEHDAEINAALEKMKIEVQECIRNSSNVQKSLRIYVFNTFMNQAKPGVLPDEKSDEVEEEPSWSLKILGRIAGDNGDDEGQIPNLKFSDFFKRIFIYLDENLYPDDHVIVWDSDRLVTPNDGLEVKRKGDKEFTAKIRAEMKYTPEKFILSKPLSEILGFEFGTHSRIVSAFWDYVRSKNLNTPNNPWLINCDPPLKRLLGDDQEEEKILKFEDAIQKLSGHLRRPKPIDIEHRIKLSGDCMEGILCYDVQVDVPFKLEKNMAALMELKNNWVTQGVEAYDKMIRADFEKLNEYRRRRASCLSFSQDPEGFVNACIDSQFKGMNHNNNDPAAASGSGNHRAGKEILSDERFNQPWVVDAVIKYLNEKTASSVDANANANVRRNPSRDAREKGKGKGKAPMK